MYKIVNVELVWIPCDRKCAFCPHTYNKNLDVSVYDRIERIKRDVKTVIAELKPDDIVSLCFNGTQIFQKAVDEDYILNVMDDIIIQFNEVLDTDCSVSIDTHLMHELSHKLEVFLMWHNVTIYTSFDAKYRFKDIREYLLWAHRVKSLRKKDIDVVIQVLETKFNLDYLRDPDALFDAKNFDCWCPVEFKPFEGSNPEWVLNEYQKQDFLERIDYNTHQHNATVELISIDGDNIVRENI